MIQGQLKIKSDPKETRAEFEMKIPIKTVTDNLGKCPMVQCVYIMNFESSCVIKRNLAGLGTYWSVTQLLLQTLKPKDRGMVASYLFP